MAIYFESLVQLILRKTGGSAGGYDAHRYEEELRQNSDFRRFDDTLRLVLDCTPQHVAEIRQFLQSHHAGGAIVYGMHEAAEALMTCLVFDLNESEHMHFSDGGDGGFAMAAREMKAQIAALAAP